MEHWVVRELCTVSTTKSAKGLQEVLLRPESPSGRPSAPIIAARRALILHIDALELVVACKDALRYAPRMSAREVGCAICGQNDTCASSKPPGKEKIILQT